MPTSGISSLPLLISDRVANYKELEVDKSGIIVKPTLESTKDALMSVIKKETNIQQMSVNAYLSAKNRYEISSVAKHMIIAYYDILDNTKTDCVYWSE